MFKNKSQFSCASFAIIFGFLVAVGVGEDKSPKAEAETNEAKPTRLYESFDKEFKLKWKPVREEKDHWSLATHPGKLTIITQRGTIHANEKADELSGGRQAKNLFVIDNPVRGTGDFTVTTCVVGFEPKTHWQQAGLLLYNDDDNYVKLVFEHNGRGLVVGVLTEIDQKSVITPLEPPESTEKMYLRISRVDSKYIAQVSGDGMEYADIHEFEWIESNPKQVGIIAKNGGNPEAGNIEAEFDFFELKSK